MEKAEFGMADIIDGIKILKRHRMLIAGTFIGFTACAAIISFSIPPTYEAVTTLRIKPPNEFANPLAADTQTKTVDTSTRIATYTEVLKSSEVIQELITKTQANKEKVTNYDEMVGRISTQQINNTETFKLKVTAKSPQEAQLAANTLAELLSSRLMELARAEQTAGRKFIGDLLSESRGELDKAEQALQQYKSLNQITDAETETKSLAETRSSLNKQAADNAINLAAAQARLAAVKQQLAEENPDFIADSPLIQQYKSKLADWEIQLITLNKKYTASHPDVIAAKATIQETKKLLAMEISRVINAEAPSVSPTHQGLLQSRITAEVEIAAAAAQQAAIESIARQSEQELGMLPVKERGLVKVMRDAEVSREIYIMLAKRYEEARISEVMQPIDLQVVASANLPERPISPNKTRNIVIGAVLGLATGIGLSFLTEYFTKTIRTAADIKRYTDIPLIGSIPDFDTGFQSSKITMWDKLKQAMLSNFRGV